MKALTRDDTDHNTLYVTMHEALAEIETMEQKMMRAQASVNLCLNAIRAYRDAKGRHNTQIACEKLLALLPENQLTKP